MTLKKYEIIGYVFYVIAAVLFTPLIRVAVLSVFAIETSEKLTIATYLLLIGEIFVRDWYFHIPAILLIISGILLIKKK